MIVSPLVHQPGRRAVDLHVARTRLAGDRVGLEASSIVNVHHGHLLELPDVGGLRAGRRRS